MPDSVDVSGSALSQPDPRIRCFERECDEEAFEKSVMSLMSKMQEKLRTMFVSEHNVLRMNHGKTWVHAAREPEPETTMHTISAEWSVPYKDITENDLTLIERTISPVSNEMDKQFSQNMYRVVGAAAQKVGNVVDAQNEKSFGHSMLEMFRKIELSVDRDGEISMPQMHVGHELYAKLPDEINRIPKEVISEIEHLKAEKIQIALIREAERKAMFKKDD